MPPWARQALGEALYWHPERAVQALERAAVCEQAEALRAREAAAAAQQQRSSAWDDGALGTVKRRVRARVAMPRAPGVVAAISELRTRDAGRMLSVRGTAVRTGPIKVIEAEKEFHCPACRQCFAVAADLEDGGAIVPPEACPVREGCRGVSFSPAEEAPRMSDFQEIKLQELLSEVGVGRVPASVVVLLEAEHAGSLRAGEDVEVVGYLVRRWQPPSKGKRCDVELAIRAVRVAKLGRRGGASARASAGERRAFESRWQAARAERRELAERDALLRAVCPQVHGLALAKLAVAITLVGGVARESATGARVRGEPHLLVVGDAGVGKSQLLRAAAALAPRATVTTGCGSTAAGLTAAAVKEGNEWALEAGALVLGDGGLCCIDEFDSMKEQDRAAIHEALEQQTVSVAKAGVVTTLRARTAVFAVTNPKGTYDRALSLEMNTSLGGPLLSRFDLVLVLPDVQRKEWDEAVADHILAARWAGADGDGDSEAPGALGADIQGSAPTQAVPSSEWTVASLRKYFAHVKDEFAPSLDASAEATISAYYQLQRQAEGRNAVRTTLRLLQSLIRIAQAHARLCCRGVASVRDAVAAILLLENSMSTRAILSDSAVRVRDDFSVEPDEDAAELEATVLKRLGLERLLER